MAAWYVWSGAAGTGTGASWVNAKTTLTAAITAAAAGDTYYVANDHAETTAALLTLTFKGTLASPDQVLCVNRGGSVPPVAADLTTGATVTTTGTTSALILRGCLYGYGLAFNCGTGSGSANLNIANTNPGSAHQIWELCAFNMVGTGASSTMGLGANKAIIDLTNCTISFGAVGQSISLASEFNARARPGSPFVTGATIPTNLFGVVSAGIATLSGLDLSSLSSGKTICGTDGGTIRLINCKLDSAVTVSAVPLGGISHCDLIGCNSSSSAERNERYHYEGTLTTETTIVRTTGASDGTTAYSWKTVTSANSKLIAPFPTFDGAIWNTVTGGAKTLTVHILTDNVTLTDAEIWVEAEYLGSSGTPVSTLINDAVATVLSTPANQTSDSGEAWTTTGIGTPVKQRLEVTFTPQMIGPVRWRVYVAKASTTIYIDPKAELV